MARDARRSYHLGVMTTEIDQLRQALAGREDVAMAILFGSAANWALVRSAARDPGRLLNFLAAILALEGVVASG